MTARIIRLPHPETLRMMRETAKAVGVKLCVRNGQVVFAFRRVA